MESGACSSWPPRPGTVALTRPCPLAGGYLNASYHDITGAGAVGDVTTPLSLFSVPTATFTFDSEGYSYDADEDCILIPHGNALVTAKINFTADRPGVGWNVGGEERLVTMLSLWKDAPTAAQGGALLARSTSFQLVTVADPWLVAKSPATLHLAHAVSGNSHTKYYLRVTGSPTVVGAFVFTLIDAHVSVVPVP